ncbi:hypothetical protein CspHIS471_0209990 [Cutaneotrichosporon sp. HIS471]|nr:hypothetical protein CspHIS471_0209990 [Cutaneotrichosporon sp. HIS471]
MKLYETADGRFDKATNLSFFDRHFCGLSDDFSNVTNSTKLKTAQTTAKFISMGLDEWRTRIARGALEPLRSWTEEDAERLSNKLARYEEVYEEKRRQLEEVASNIYSREDKALYQQFREHEARRCDEVWKQHVEYKRMAEQYRGEFAREQHRRGHERAERAPPRRALSTNQSPSSSQGSTATPSSGTQKRPLSPSAGASPFKKSCKRSQSLPSVYMGILPMETDSEEDA